MAAADRYIEDSANWRLAGGRAEPLSEAAAARIMACRMPYDIPGFAILDATARQFLPVNGFSERIGFDPASQTYVQRAPWNHSVARYLLFAQYTHRHGLQGLFALNLFDAQPWDYQSALALPAPVPVFQMSREVDQPGVILWPAEAVFMGPDSKYCPAANTDTMPFRQKMPRAVWRGRLSGVLRHGTSLFWAEAVKRQLLDQRIGLSDYLLLNMFHRFPRFGFVARYRDCPACDVAFVQEDGHHHYDGLIDNTPGLAPWRKLYGGQITPARQLEFRYICCLEGNDYATGLFWALNSNSVVLMPPVRWETVLHFGLEPWTHYIPLDGELDDLETKIAWGNAHPEECEAIAARANSFMRWQNGPALRAAIDLAVMRRYLGGVA